MSLWLLWLDGVAAWKLGQVSVRVCVCLCGPCSADSSPLSEETFWLQSRLSSVPALTSVRENQIRFHGHEWSQKGSLCDIIQENWWRSWKSCDTVNVARGSDRAFNQNRSSSIFLHLMPCRFLLVNITVIHSHHWSVSNHYLGNLVVRKSFACHFKVKKRSRDSFSQTRAIFTTTNLLVINSHRYYLLCVPLLHFSGFISSEKIKFN